MMCAERGYKCIIVMPIDMSEERKKMMEFFGAKMVFVEEGDFDGAIELKCNMAKQWGYVELNQFNNPLNVECHLNTTFMEIMNATYPSFFPHNSVHLPLYVPGSSTIVQAVFMKPGIASCLIAKSGIHHE